MVIFTVLCLETCYFNGLRPLFKRRLYYPVAQHTPPGFNPARPYQTSPPSSMYGHPGASNQIRDPYQQQPQVAKALFCAPVSATINCLLPLVIVRKFAC